MRAIFRRHLNLRSVLLFGSRAKGTHHPASDIDLAVVGIDDPLGAEAIASELDELRCVLRWDVKAYATIRSPALRAHIERVGVVVYDAERDSAGQRLEPAEAQSPSPPQS